MERRNRKRWNDNFSRVVRLTLVDGIGVYSVAIGYLGNKFVSQIAIQRLYDGQYGDVLGRTLHRIIFIYK